MQQLSWQHAAILWCFSAACCVWCRRLFQQLVLAVDYLHAKGVCHRDIKLDNLLLVMRLCTRVTDAAHCSLHGAFNAACG